MNPAYKIFDLNPQLITGKSDGGSFNNRLINIKNINTLSVPITCPDGYVHCYEQNYIYGDAQAIARVYVSDPYIENGSLYVNCRTDGTKSYVYRSITSWDQVVCDSGGCNGTSIGSNNKYLLGTTPSTTQAGVVFVVWDYNSYNSYWAWTWVGFGWFNDFYYDLQCKQPSCNLNIN